MCEGCNLVVCDPRCPYNDARPPRRCKECGGPIWEGMECYNSDDGPVCMDCLEDKDIKELFALVGVRLDVA